MPVTIATTARPPGAPPAHPDLAIGLALARPGEDPGGTGARVLASIAARGHKAGWPGYDRAYTQALPARFHLPARALGYKPVMDYRIDQPGIQANRPFSSGSAVSIESEGSCMRSPPREGAQRPDVAGVHRRSVRLDALRFSGNPRPVAPRMSEFTRATTGRLMLARSTGHATAMPHSARISRCVIPRTNRPHLPHSARQIVRDAVVPPLRRRSTMDDSRPLMTTVGETIHIDESRRDCPGDITFSN